MLAGARLSPARLWQVELARRRSRLKRLSRGRIDQLPLLPLEALQLKLPLLRENVALQSGLGVTRKWIRARAVSPRAIAVNLLLLELLLLEALPEVKLVEPALIRGIEIGTSRTHALLEMQGERVLMLLHLELPALHGSARRVHRGRELRCGDEGHDEADQSEEERLVLWHRYSDCAARGGFLSLIGDTVFALAGA